MLFLKNIFTSLLRIYSSFLHIFYFFKYFESVNSKPTYFKIWWGPNLSNFNEF
jgi:membrane-associated protease RseP (regulator of RpoE activity)